MIKYINAETGEEIKPSGGGQLVYIYNQLWEVDFGSCDSRNNPQKMWAGEGSRVNEPFRIELT